MRKSEVEDGNPGKSDKEQPGLHRPLSRSWHSWFS